jgi:hypothetical protein
MLTVAPIQVSSRRSYSPTLTATVFPPSLVSIGLWQLLEPHLTSINTGTPTKAKATPKGKKSAPAATPSKKRAKKVDSDDEDDEDEGRTLLSKRKKSTKIVKREDSDDDWRVYASLTLVLQVQYRRSKSWRTASRRYRWLAALATTSPYYNDEI